jgi:hypothetical protein
VKRYSLDKPSIEKMGMTPQQLRQAAFIEITNLMRYHKLEELLEIRTRRQQRKKQATTSP